MRWWRVSRGDAVTVSAGGGPGFRESGRDGTDEGAPQAATGSGPVAATPPAEPVLADVIAQRDALQARIDAYEGKLAAAEEVERLIAASSLGTPEARALRAHTPPLVGRTIVVAATERARADDALDALESMVEQYLYVGGADVYDHMFMAPGEEACEVLARLRPDRWEQTRIGIRRR